MIEAKEGRNPLGPIIREPQLPPGRSWDDYSKPKEPTDEESIVDLIDDETPKSIKHAIGLISEMPFSDTAKRSILTYYFWVEDNGDLDKAEKHMKIPKNKAGALLSAVMESDELSQAYIELEQVLSLSRSIFNSHKGPKTDERLMIISEIVKLRLKQGMSAEDILQDSEKINALSGGSKIRSFNHTKEHSEKTESRKAKFKKILDEHIKQHGFSPFNLRALSSREDLPSYSTLKRYYYEIKSESLVPPLLRGRPISNRAGKPMAREGDLTPHHRSRESRQVRIAMFKKILDDHLRDFGQTPINLNSLALKNGLPTYLTLLNYYHVINRTSPVPPLLISRKR